MRARCSVGRGLEPGEEKKEADGAGKGESGKIMLPSRQARVLAGNIVACRPAVVSLLPPSPLAREVGTRSGCPGDGGRRYGRVARLPFLAADAVRLLRATLYVRPCVAPKWEACDMATDFHATTDAAWLMLRVARTAMQMQRRWRRHLRPVCSQ